MIEHSYKITDPNGMHAIPAGLLVNLAGNYQSDISIEKGQRTANIKQIINLMNLAIKHGDEITIRVDGIDENDAMEKVFSFFKENL